MPFRSPLVLLVLAACGRPDTGDLDLFVLDGDQAADTATLALDRVELTSCGLGDDEATVWIGYRMDLVHPDPLPVPTGQYCGLRLVLVDDRDPAPLAITGTTAAGTEFSLELDPGVVSVAVQTQIQSLADSLLVLDLDLLVDDAHARDLDAMGTPADVLLGDPLSDELAARVPGALVWLDTPAEGEFTYGSRWPGPDLGAEARITSGGCGGDRPLAWKAGRDVAADPIVGWDGPTDGFDTGETGDTGGSTPPPSSSGCGGGGGCDGDLNTSSCTADASPGCQDPTAGCTDTTVSCSTRGPAPAHVPLIWAGLATLLARRRPRPDHDRP